MKKGDTLSLSESMKFEVSKHEGGNRSRTITLSEEMKIKKLLKYIKPGYEITTVGGWYAVQTASGRYECYLTFDDMVEDIKTGKFRF